MNNHRHIGMVLGALVALSSGAAEVNAAPLDSMTVNPAISSTATFDQATVASFAGHWQLTVIGQTGCGFGTAVYSATLNAAGSGSASGTLHNGCGDSSTGNVGFSISSVDAHGSGTGGLTCGAGCGWSLKVQLAPNHDVFSFVDVDPTNPGNFISGTAVRQSY